MSQPRTRVSAVTVRNRTPLAQVQEHKRQAAPKDPPERIPEKNTRPLGFGERMLRNTAISVALLLTVLAAQSLNTPGATGATNLLAEIVSIDLNESLGSLRFVSNFLPESAAVFWNLGAEKHSLPSEAAVAHAFSSQEPWVAYGPGEVQATAAGEVMSVATDAAGRSTVRIRHAGGMETLYGNMVITDVREGDWVESGAIIGSAKQLIYELRGEGRSMNPAPFLK